MFENIKLISKRDNKVQGPNLNWRKPSNIHCVCELNLGLGEKIVWTNGNAIRLTQLIEFYRNINHAIRKQDKNIYEYSFRHNDLNVIISYTSEMYFIVRYKFWRTERVVLEKRINCNIINDFYIQIMGILIENTTCELCKHVGKLFFLGQETSHEYEFEIGEKVKTIIGNRVKTYREGIIVNRFYHNVQKINMYQLLTNDKKLINWYYYPNNLKKTTDV